MEVLSKEMNSSTFNQIENNFQLLLQLVAANFSRFRDYHRHNDTVSEHLHQFPKVVIASILSIWANATPYALTDNVNLNQSGYCHPTIQMYSTTWGNQSLGIWEIPCDHSEKILNGTSPQFIEVTSAPLGFTYCNVDKKEKFSVWKFNIFADPFDIWTWLLFVVALALVVTLSTFTISGENEQETFHQVIMSTLSATLGLGTRELRRRSKLFLLWMGMCLVIPTFYIGAIQSTLITPPEDDVMKTFDELKERNYSLAVGESSSYFKTRLVAYLESIPFSSSGEILKWLLKTVRSTSDLGLVDILAFEEGKWVTVGPWYASHLYNWLPTRRISERSFSPTERKKARRCHVGEELVTLGAEFFAFNPPGNDKPSWGFKALLHAGIYQRWDEETSALMHSERVQDRVRVKSPRIILKMEASTINPLGMNGKIATVFLLWITCIIFCVIRFCFEFCMYLQFPCRAAGL